MGEVNGWTISRQNQLDQRWRERLIELAQFIRAHAAMPKYRNHSAEHERALGVWLHKQHQARTEGRLSQWRLDALSTARPGWRCRT